MKKYCQLATFGCNDNFGIRDVKPAKIDTKTPRQEHETDITV
jgi:hypothetical protein